MEDDKLKNKEKQRKDSLVRFLDRISFSQTFLLWLGVIIFFAVIYFVLSLGFHNSLMYRNEVIESNAKGFMNSIYFSFITATTLGYGDIAPIGFISKFFAAAEVVIGLIIWGVVISKLISVKQEVILEEVYDISYEELLDRQRSGLYLFRSDINRVVEKVESGSIKPREIKDLWMVLSGLDTTLSNIKKLIMPHKSEKYYYKKIDVFRLELLLNSIRLSVDKLLDLIKTLKSNKVEWRNELLVTSILEDIKLVREIVDSQNSDVSDKKVADRLNELKKIVNEIDKEVLEAEVKEEKKDKLLENKPA